MSIFIYLYFILFYFMKFGILDFLEYRKEGKERRFSFCTDKENNGRI
jgi:hypothetical protein